MNSLDAPELEVAPESGDPGGPTTRRRRRRRRSRRAQLVELVVVVAVAVVIAFVIRTFAFEAFYVPSQSMLPTLQPGDRIIVDKAFFNPGSLKTGDIIVFKRPKAAVMCASEEGDFVKRVIGLPGETIYSKGNTIYIDGKVLKEPWLPRVDPLGSQGIARQVVPPHQYYVLGDNRATSCDSRYWGTVPGSTIVGRVFALIWRHGRPDLHFF